MTDTKMITLDTIQLKRQELNFQSYPKPKKQFVCLYGKKCSTNYRLENGLAAGTLAAVFIIKKIYTLKNGQYKELFLLFSSSKIQTIGYKIINIRKFSCCFYHQKYQPYVRKGSKWSLAAVFIIKNTNHRLENGQYKKNFLLFSSSKIQTID